MGPDEDLGVLEELDGLGDVRRPGVGVADLGATQGEDVVQRVVDVLGNEEDAVVGQVEVHLRGRLGVRHQLEEQPHTVDHELLAGAGDGLGGRDEADGAGGQGLAQAEADRCLGADRQ